MLRRVISKFSYINKGNILNSFLYAKVFCFSKNPSFELDLDEMEILYKESKKRKRQTPKSNITNVLLPEFDQIPLELKKGESLKLNNVDLSEVRLLDSWEVDSLIDDIFSGTNKEIFNNIDKIYNETVWDEINLFEQMGRADDYLQVVQEYQNRDEPTSKEHIDVKTIKSIAAVKPDKEISLDQAMTNLEIFEDDIEEGKIFKKIIKNNNNTEENNLVEIDLSLSSNIKSKSQNQDITEKITKVVSKKKKTQINKEEKEKPIIADKNKTSISPRKEKLDIQETLDKSIKSTKSDNINIQSALKPSSIKYPSTSTDEISELNTTLSESSSAPALAPDSNPLINISHKDYVKYFNSLKVFDLTESSHKKFIQLREDEIISSKFDKFFDYIYEKKFTKGKVKKIIFKKRENTEQLLKESFDIIKTKDLLKINLGGINLMQMSRNVFESILSNINDPKQRPCNINIVYNSKRIIKSGIGYGVIMIYADDKHLTSLIYSIGKVENLQMLDFFNTFVNIQLVELLERYSGNSSINYNLVMAKKFDVLAKLNSVNRTKNIFIIMEGKIKGSGMKQLKFFCYTKYMNKDFTKYFKLAQKLENGHINYFNRN